MWFRLAVVFAQAEGETTQREEMDGLVETLRDHPDKVIAVAVIFATGE